jgi:DNA-binding CsgD family transcriptional regulator
MAELGTDAVAALAETIEASGQDRFAGAFLDSLRALSGGSLCSAFKVDIDGSLGYVFAAGNHTDIPNFAETASRDYAKRYWLRDRVARQVVARQASGTIQIVRQSSSAIKDAEYRQICYERARVLERVTLFSARGPRVFASIYKTCDQGAFSPDQLDRIELVSPMLIAALIKHIGLMKAAASKHSLVEIASVLEGAYSLSKREAEVAAGLMLRMTQNEISLRLGISLATVITYRQRAYAKLGSSNRRDLQMLHRDLFGFASAACSP